MPQKIRILLTGLALVFLLLWSCSKDSDSSGVNQDNEQLTNEQNETEDTKIGASLLESGIIIEGATKITGAPPSPNNTLDFRLNTDLTEAYQSYGYSIEFSSTAPIAGAYIRFKDVDGNAASNYFDIPSSAFNKGVAAKKTAPRKKLFSAVGSNFNTDEEITVRFETEIPAGQFCYEICVYDASNAISQIENVCLNVASWGGNESIVGAWVLDRYEPTDNGLREVDCRNGELIEVPYALPGYEEGTELILREDGTHALIFDAKGSFLNYFATSDNCSAVYNDFEIEKEKYSGKWSFNEEQTLILVNFKYDDLFNPDNNIEYEFGTLEFDDGKVNIINGQLVLTITDAGITESIYFNRK